MEGYLSNSLVSIYAHMQQQLKGPPQLYTACHIAAAAAHGRINFMQTPTRPCTCTSAQTSVCERSPAHAGHHSSQRSPTATTHAAHCELPRTTRRGLCCRKAPRSARASLVPCPTENTSQSPWSEALSGPPDRQTAHAEPSSLQARGKAGLRSAAVSGAQRRQWHSTGRQPAAICVPAITSYPHHSKEG